jgi:hypothetical protein
MDRGYGIFDEIDEVGAVAIDLRDGSAHCRFKKVSDFPFQSIEMFLCPIQFGVNALHPRK